jgi:hypothetical protein
MSSSDTSPSTESTGLSTSGMMTTLPLSEVNETFAVANDGFVDASPSVAATPSAQRSTRSNFNLDDFETRSEGSIQSEHATVNPGIDSYQIFAGISSDLRKFYHQIYVGQIPPPLVINGFMDPGMPQVLRCHFTFREGQLVRGPGGRGFWRRYFFSGDPHGPLKLVRQYFENGFKYVYMFDLIFADNDMADRTFPVNQSGTYRSMLDLAQIGTSQLRPSAVDLSDGGPIPTDEAQEEVTGSQNLPFTQGVSGDFPSHTPAAQRSRSPNPRFNANEGYNGEREGRRSFNHNGNDHTRSNGAPSAGGARVWNDGQHQENSRNGNQGNPYHTAPMQGEPFTTFSGTTFFNQGNNRRGNFTTSHQEFVAQPSVPAETASQSPSVLNNGATGTTVTELFTTSEPPVTFMLKGITLACVYAFVTAVNNFNMHIKSPRARYPISKAVPHHLLKTLSGGTRYTPQQIAQFDSDTLLRFLKWSVEPQGPRAMLAVFQSNAVLKFNKTYNYDLRQLACRAIYLKDILTYLKDCEDFFTFMITDLANVRANMPTMWAKPKVNGLVEITLSKIPGMNPDSKYNYARSIVDDPNNSPLFKMCFSSRTHIREAYPEFLRVLTDLLNNGISTFHRNMEEELLFDQSQEKAILHISLGTFGLEEKERADSHAELDKKSAEKHEKYYARKKEIFSGKPTINNHEEVYANEDSDEEQCLPLTTLPIAENPEFDPLYNVYEAATRAMQASSQEQPARMKAFGRALEPAGRYILQKGESKEPFADMPRVCLRFLFKGEGKCKNPCPYSHAREDYVKLAKAVQEEYRKDFGPRNSKSYSNQPPRESSNYKPKDSSGYPQRDSSSNSYKKSRETRDSQEPRLQVLSDSKQSLLAYASEASSDDELDDSSVEDSGSDVSEDH